MIIAMFMSVTAAQAQYIPGTIPPDKWRNYWFSSDLIGQIEFQCRTYHLGVSQDYHRDPAGAIRAWGPLPWYSMAFVGGKSYQCPPYWGN
jgi:hypothetical protein